MKANKKKIIVLVSMVLLLVTVGCLNFFLNPKTPSPVNPGDGNTQTIFASIRTERTLTRNAELEVLDSIITFATSTKEAIDEAQKQKIVLTKIMEKELLLESLVKAKGFKDCLVVIGTENINVTVMDSDLTPEENARVLSVIALETGKVAGNILITPYV